AFALEDQVIQLIGVGPDAVNASAEFNTRRGSNLRLGGKYGYSSTLPFVAVPLARQGIDDIHFVYAEAYPPGAGTDRIAMRLFKDAQDPKNTSLTIPDEAFSSAQVKIIRPSPHA